MRSTSVAAAVALLCLPAALPAAATPVTYTFTTDTQNNVISLPALQGKFSGPVSGSFVYDAATPAGLHGAAPAFGLNSFTQYAGALGSISGSVGGLTFVDSTGGNVVVSNDAFIGPTGNVDLVTITSDPAQIGTGFPRSLTGFTIAGYKLVNVRLFWFETLTPSAPDFLTSEDLPATLPSFAGRLALDFMPESFVEGPAPVISQSFAFFDGLIATPVRTRVPEPATGGLIAGAIAALASFARRRRPAH